MLEKLKRFITDVDFIKDLIEFVVLSLCVICMIYKFFTTGFSVPFMDVCKKVTPLWINLLAFGFISDHLVSNLWFIIGHFKFKKKNRKEDEDDSSSN